MQYLWQHLEHILLAYDGKLPLHHFLKSYFKAHPKLGSRDRRGLSDAVYAWYRAGKAVAHLPLDLQSKRLAAMQLCGLQPKAFAPFFALESQIDAKPEAIFPYDIPFSKGITADQWRASMWQQPRLFLRIRKDAAMIERKLSESGIAQEWISESCLALPNGTKLEGILPENTYVVQDASSQATGVFLKSEKGEDWWDCCAGAGGKSLMLADYASGISHLATDVRESILLNLEARFRQYHLPLPERRVVNAADRQALNNLLGNRRFNGIICDVPCSGSGTWARTPEACYFFKPESLAEYAARQSAILKNALRYLKEEGRLVYITCSVFREENEGILEAVQEETPLIVESAGLINGISLNADSLFAAVLRKA